MGSQDFTADIRDLELKQGTQDLTEDEKKSLIWLREQVAKGYINAREYN